MTGSQVVRVRSTDEALAGEITDLLVEAGWQVVDEAGSGVLEVSVGAGAPAGSEAVWVAVVGDLVELVSAARAGARGLVPVSEVTLLPAVAALAAEGMRVVPTVDDLAELADGVLSSERQELLRLLAKGHTDIEIGRRLGYSRRQVQRLLRDTLETLGVEGRRQALVLAGLLGVVVR